MEAEIYDSIARDFAGTPAAVDLAARRHLTAEPTPEQLQVGRLACSVCSGRLPSVASTCI